MHSTIQNCSQYALVILQMHSFETSDDDKNNLISLVALQSAMHKCWRVVSALFLISPTCTEVI